LPVFTDSPSFVDINKEGQTRTGEVIRYISGINTYYPDYIYYGYFIYKVTINNNEEVASKEGKFKIAFYNSFEDGYFDGYQHAAEPVATVATVEFNVL